MMRSRRNIDRLSNMPNEVISHILSLMPTKYAVRTCVLSKSWVHSWKSVTNLVFVDKYPCHEMHYFIKFVDRVLECCKASQIQRFRLHCSEIWVPRTVKRWIGEAIRLNVSEIELHSMPFDLPHPFLCKKLTKLTLVCNRDWDDWNIISPIDLPILKTLDIKVYTKPNHNAFKIIPGCPVLESLSLEVSSQHWYDNNEVYKFNIPTLKRLKLHCGKGVCIKKIVLNVPNLEELVYSGRLCPLVVMENFPPLVSVTLSCLFAPGLHQAWDELLTVISGAKSITMHLLNNNPSKSPLPKYLNLKHLEFNNVYAHPMHWLLINQIFESSDELEHLCIEETPKGRNTVVREDSCWIEPQFVPTCMLNNLRAIKFLNMKGWKTEKQFMAYMLRNAQVLKTLSIMCDSIPLEEELRLKAELLKFPRESRCCEIHFNASGSRLHVPSLVKRRLSMICKERCYVVWFASMVMIEERLFSCVLILQEMFEVENIRYLILN